MIVVKSPGVFEVGILVYGGIITPIDSLVTLTRTFHISYGGGGIILNLLSSWFYPSNIW